MTIYNANGETINPAEVGTDTWHSTDPSLNIKTVSRSNSGNFTLDIAKDGDPGSSLRLQVNEPIDGPQVLNFVIDDKTRCRVGDDDPVGGRAMGTNWYKVRKMDCSLETVLPK